MRDTDASTRPSIYDLAQAYDIAFDFRNLAAECDVLDTLCIEYGVGHPPESVLDICCGSGYHCIEYAKRGARSSGLDLNRQMIQFADEKSRAAGVSVEFLHGDMRDFAIARPAELALCAMSSVHHLLTHDDILAHFRCVAQSLTAGGLYVIEADHPRDVFGVGQSLKHAWESERDGIVVNSSWGGLDDAYDPITQIATLTVTMEARGNGNSVRESRKIQLRRVTHQEFILLIETSRVFEPVAWLGSLEGSVPMSNEKESNRMIAVLRKRSDQQGVID